MTTNSSIWWDKIQTAKAAIAAKIGSRTPRVGLILGSGLGPYADRIQDAVAIPYSEIPGFPSSSVAGHAGRLVVGKIGNTDVVAMQGRVHYYEGHDLGTVVFPARTMVALGARTFVITNAAGGIHNTYRPGDLVLIRDHLNLMGTNPLLGPNDERIGPRFPDMTEAYSHALRKHARRTADRLGITLREGVYAALTGPTYETPAEIRMMQTLGADLVGMSTVPEVTAVTHMGARAIGISCVTNLAAGLSGEKLSHAEVTETAKRIENTFASLLDGLLDGIVEVSE